MSGAAISGLAYILIALIVGGGAVAWALSDRVGALATLDRRLARLAGGVAPVRTERRIGSAEPLAIPGRLVPLLARAQVEIEARQVRLAVAGVGLVGLLLLVLSGPVAALVALLGLPFAVFAWLRHRAEKRIGALIEALPHFIDAMRQLQTVGNSLSQSIERALAEAPPIVVSYFAPAARRLEMGAPVGETMQALADRLQVPEISMLAAAIRTNLRFGGSISATFSNLAQILRDRLRVKRDLAAATSEPRTSAKVLVAMPLVAMVMLVMINPAYINFFVDDRRGHKLAVIALVLEAIGILVIRRMMRLAF